MSKDLRVITEKDGIRGLVPSRMEGRKDVVYNEYLKTLDPRNNLDVQCALAASTDNRYTEFLERISLPKYRRMSLATIAKGCNIGLGEFNSWWQKASTQRAIAVAQTKTIEITEDMAKDALSIEDVCPRCDGLRFVAAPAGLPKETPGYKMVDGEDEDEKWIRDCPKCQNGKVRKPGDSHARDRILEMSGIIQKGKALVSIVQNFDGMSHASAVSQMDEAMTIDISADEM